MTKAVILAAGFGSRLMPLTVDRPKGMVDLMEVPLLVRQISVMRAVGVTDIWIVGGYRSECLNVLGVPVIPNVEFDTTNMVESLMCARHLLDGKDDIIVAYGDIVYEPRVLEGLLSAQGSLVLTADLGWKRLWSMRMDDYSSDVESFRLRADGTIFELGKRPNSLSEVEAQYIGLIRFSADIHDRLLAFYDQLDRTAFYDGQPFKKMYMTSFIQRLIEFGWNVRPFLIENGWLEVDTVEDLTCYESLASAGNLDQLFQLPQLPDALEFLRQLLPEFVDVPPGVYDISAVSACMLDTDQPTRSTIDALDRLARKIEINGIVHQRYEQTDMKPMPGSPSVSQLTMAAFLAAYLVAYDRTQDRRFLNTVLKALDGVMHTPRPAYLYELNLMCARRLPANV